MVTLVFPDLLLLTLTHQWDLDGFLVMFSSPLIIQSLTLMVQELDLLRVCKTKLHLLFFELTFFKIIKRKKLENESFLPNLFFSQFHFLSDSQMVSPFDVPIFCVSF